MKYKKLLNGSFFIMILIIASKLLGLIRDSLIAKSFGLSYLNDIYMFSLGTTMLFISISYGITSALIPIHTYIKENGDIKERNRYISNVITVISIITFIIVVLGIIGAGSIVSVFASSFKEDINIYNQAVLLVRVMFISLIFVAVQSILTAVLQCHNRFIATSLMPVFSNVIYILYLIFFIDRYGLNGFGIATVLGFLSMLLINIPGFRKLEYKYNFVFDLKDENLKALGKSMLPIVICASLVQINVFIVRSFAGTLETGSISSLDYANKLNMLVYEVFAQAISMVVYPKLSSLASRSDYKGFNKEISKGINFIFLLMVPAAFGLLTLRIPLISLYLERGAFGSNEVIMTSSALIFYIPTMVIYGVRDLVNRGFYSLKESKIPMYNAVLNIILNIAFCFITVKILGVQGLALSNSLATLLSTLILIFSLKKKVSSLDISTITRTFIKISIASIVMAVVVNFTNMIFSSYLGTFGISKLISVVLSTLTGVVIYVILLYVFKIEEFLEYKRLIFKK